MACGSLSPGGIVRAFRGSGNVQCGSSMVVGHGFALRKAGRQEREEDEASETLERKAKGT